MSRQHTPGPWKVVPYEHDSAWECIEANGAHLACVSRAANAANARLIVAAPRMLNEIRNARAGFAVVMNHTLPNEAIHGLAKENFDRLGLILKEIEDNG